LRCDRSLSSPIQFICTANHRSPVPFENKTPTVAPICHSTTITPVLTRPTTRPNTEIYAHIDTHQISSQALRKTSTGSAIYLCPVTFAIDQEISFTASKLWVCLPRPKLILDEQDRSEGSCASMVKKVVTISKELLSNCTCSWTELERHIIYSLFCRGGHSRKVLIFCLRDYSFQPTCFR
jgi:hypothetical protein